MRPDPGDGITVQVKKAPSGETRAVFARRILLPREPLPRPGGRVVGTLYIMRSFLVLPVLAFSILGVVWPGAQEAPSSLEFLNRLLARGEPGAPPSPPADRAPGRSRLRRPIRRPPGPRGVPGRCDPERPGPDLLLQGLGRVCRDPLRFPGADPGIGASERGRAVRSGGAGDPGVRDRPPLRRRPPHPGAGGVQRSTPVRPLDGGRADPGDFLRFAL